MTQHALARVRRLLDAGIPEDHAGAYLARAEAIARGTREALAVRLGRCRYAGTWDTSNGDEVWAIIRDGAVATLMLRRHTQPKRPEAMSVARVILHPAEA